MRILFLHSAREWSGTARAFAVAARGLAARGHHVSYVAESDSSVHQSASKIAAVAERIGGTDPVAQRDVARFDVVPFSWEGPWLGIAWRLRHLFRRWDADAVFVTTEREQLIAATACWLGGGGAVVRRIPAGLALEQHFTGRFAGWLIRTTHLFANEDDARRSNEKRIGRALIAVLGVDVARYPHRTDEASPQSPEDVGIRYIICVYDPSSRGRAATAIRTVSLLAPRHPYLRMMIFGAGSDSEDLRMQAAALGMLDIVSFLGERDDHLTLMRDADLGWVVAEGDTAAYGILDLMALGVPVLAAEGSIAEAYVANMISGALLPPEDAWTSAATVVSLLTKDDERVAMGAAGRTRVAREFREQAMVEGFENAANAVGRHR